MRKKFIQKKSSLIRKVKSVRINEIVPFREQPMVEHIQQENKSVENDGQLHASQLFSLFTADIIKQNVIFTR